MTEERELSNRVVVVPLRGEADLPVARRLVAAALERPGAAVVLDLGDLALLGPAGDEVRAFVAEFEGLAGTPGGACVVCREPAPDGLGSAPWHASLLACLAALAPLEHPPLELAITLAARLEYLGPVRKHIAGAVKALHGEADAFQAEILVDELCLNAVENSPSPNDSYDVAFRCEGHEFQVDVTNLFDGASNPERTMHGRLESFDDSGGYLGERGRGLFLIARIADGLQIRSIDGDRIRVTVTKRLRGGPASGATVGARSDPGA